MGGIRTRTVVAAAAVVAFALAFGGVVLRIELRRSVESSITDETLTRATGVAQLVATGDFPKVLVASERTPAWVQVIDASGTVVASTANVASLGRPFAPVPRGTAASVRILQNLPIDTGERVAVASVSTLIRETARRLTVLAAGPLDIAETADRRALRSMLLVFPGLLLIAAVTVWFVVRHALRPVEAMRARVATISTSDLTRRVPVPDANDEIGRLATTMNDMLARLQASHERQRRFVGDASHELRSPLASLRNQLEVSVLENPDPAWSATVTDMIADHERLERLVRDLLLLARHDASEDVTLEPVDLGWLVRNQLDRRPLAPGIERVVRAENALVSGNADSLARILRNLVDNAERHAATRVEILVRAVSGASPPTTELVVADDGPGIPAHDRRTVFERFRRLDDARAADGGGSGLGLAIVADLVEEHGGTVHVDPAGTDAQQGARLVVRLPTLAA